MSGKFQLKGGICEVNFGYTTKWRDMRSELGYKLLSKILNRTSQWQMLRAFKHDNIKKGDTIHGDDQCSAPTNRVGNCDPKEAGGGLGLDVWNSKPRRLIEIWKLDRKTKTVVALGLEGVVQLNAVGSALWLRLDGEHTIRCIVDELVRAYPSQDQSRIKIDVMSFINYLIANHLVILNWHPLSSGGLPERLESAP